ncbi:MAG TPA: hypothetical protein PKO41_09135 [Dokdonella sp.]|uniref:hypothetical protein n=1 Tax=Dokdonella sp. TaxID=2291710 RepID=UPI0025C19850|nr:hypothetical protein [Dokdonella sp.]MBX3692488.1 hypothetical protein [Dokdonella sp.]MCW5569233.1 hypothetical protein [Dokdonella sp.]HNR92575.1 hypothetical protein [Dokdonella sp.]
MKRILTLATLVALTAFLLGGCSFIRSKFGNKPDAYKSAQQSRPLEVPPDLEAPNTSGALAVPQQRVATNVTPSSAPIDEVAAPPQAALVAGGAQLGDEGLRITDTPASAWRRVGLALERSGAAVIESRDDAAGTYQVLANATVSQRPGWFKRAITFGRAADRKVGTRVPLLVRVRADGEASMVVVEGTNDAASTKAARDLLAVLRQRLL